MARHSMAYPSAFNRSTSALVLAMNSPCSPGDADFSGMGRALQYENLARLRARLSVRGLHSMPSSLLSRSSIMSSCHVPELNP